MKKLTDEEKIEIVKTAKTMTETMIQSMAAKPYELSMDLARASIIVMAHMEAVITMVNTMWELETDFLIKLFATSVIDQGRENAKH